MRLALPAAFLIVAAPALGAQPQAGGERACVLTVVLKPARLSPVRFGPGGVVRVRLPWALKTLNELSPKATRDPLEAPGR